MAPAVVVDLCPKVIELTVYALHTDPIWRDRADFIINASIEDASTVRAEQLWTRLDAQTGLHEICCIPFFIYDVSLGDLVSVRGGGEDGYLLDRVIKQSDHFSFRIFFGGVDSPIQEAVLADLGTGPILVERYSKSLIAADVEGLDSAQKLADYLADAQSKGRLGYETGRQG